MKYKKGTVYKIDGELYECYGYDEYTHEFILGLMQFDDFGELVSVPEALTMRILRVAICSSCGSTKIKEIKSNLLDDGRLHLWVCMSCDGEKSWGLWSDLKFEDNES